MAQTAIIMVLLIRLRTQPKGTAKLVASPIRCGNSKDKVNASSVPGKMNQQKPAMVASMAVYRFVHPDIWFILVKTQANSMGRTRLDVSSDGCNHINKRKTRPKKRSMAARHPQWCQPLPCYNSMDSL